MAEARMQADWSQTASVMALLANCHRDPKKTQPFNPSDFDPTTEPPAPPKVGIGVLKDVFIDGTVPSVAQTGGQ